MQCFSLKRLCDGGAHDWVPNDDNSHSLGSESVDSPVGGSFPLDKRIVGSGFLGLLSSLLGNLFSSKGH